MSSEVLNNPLNLPRKELPGQKNLLASANFALGNIV